jgi:NAD(P)-dependent dehydrogenase (short-subunit alcohol dehydrogenase family)
MSETRVDELFNLSGRVAIVTGASSGLGVWFSRGLAEAGADLVLAARRKQKLQQVAQDLCKLGVRALPVGTDITCPDQVHNLVNAALREFGRIDILVNNAGLGIGEKRIDQFDLREFRRVVEINLFGTVICTQAVCRVMVEQGEGRIINVSSVHALRADAMDNSAAYCASKAAVLNLTRELGKQLAPYGIRVNGIAPGLFPTEMTAWYWETAARESEAISNPLGRAGQEDDLKGLIVFLASPAADYIVGQTIIVDGGQTLV